MGEWNIYIYIYILLVSASRHLLRVSTSVTSIGRRGEKQSIGCLVIYFKVKKNTEWAHLCPYVVKLNTISPKDSI